MGDAGVGGLEEEGVGGRRLGRPLAMGGNCLCVCRLHEPGGMESSAARVPRLMLDTSLH